MKQLSIIVPVYQVERYIRACMESIFRQGLNDDVFEVIIVNDGTKDRSMEMIQDIIAMHDNITVIHQENLSLSVARNNGIAAAQGEYILMPDSDDLLVENSLKVLLDKALETKADLVVADFLEMDDEEIAAFQSPVQRPAEFEEKNGERLLLEDLNPYQCYVWRTLFRRQFLLDLHLSFVPGIRYQDVPFTHECYIKAKRCLRTHWLLNIYRRGHESATYSFNQTKSRDFMVAIAKTWELTRLEGLSPAVQKRLRNDVFTSFSVLIYTISHDIDDRQERKAIIQEMKRRMANVQFQDGVRQKVFTFLFRHMPHTLISTRRFYGKLVEDQLMPFLRSRR